MIVNLNAYMSCSIYVKYADYYFNNETTVVYELRCKFFWQNIYSEGRNSIYCALNVSLSMREVSLKAKL